MLKAIGKAVVHSLGLRPPGRNVEVFADDVFVVSYPKSGNTWVRFLIAHLVAEGRPVDFSSVQEIVPGIDWLPANKLRSLARPRILKSHEYFDPRYGKLLYLVRDPRDVVVSYYHHDIRRRLIPEGYPMEQYVERFLDGRLDPYGSWHEHVGSWLGARESDPGFLLVRYEDLSAAPRAGTAPDRRLPRAAPERRRAGAGLRAVVVRGDAQARALSGGDRGDPEPGPRAAALRPLGDRGRLAPRAARRRSPRGSRPAGARPWRRWATANPRRRPSSPRRPPRDRAPSPTFRHGAAR